MPATFPFVASIATVLAVAHLHAQEAPPDSAPKVVQVDGKIRFSVDDEAGMPLPEFIRLAEKIIDRPIIYSPNEVAAPQAVIHMEGSLEMERGPEEFYRFFQRMLYVRGFACVVSKVGDDEIVELVNMQGPRRNEIGSSASFVPVDEVDAYREQAGVQILTVVTLVHINANTAATATRPFFAQNAAAAGGLLLGNLGDGRSMLLQGYGPQVCAAVQLLKIADVPPESLERVVRVVELAHASAAELRATVEKAVEHDSGVAQSRMQQGLPLDDRGPFSVVGHEALNALVLKGHPRDVELAVDLVRQLDAPRAPGTEVDAIVALRHARADLVAASVRELFADDAEAGSGTGAGGPATPSFAAPRLSVAVDARTNSLLLRGDRARVGRARELAEQIDAAPQAAASVARLTIDGERVGFAIPEGAELPMLEMIEIAQRVTGKVLTFRRSEVAGSDLAISLVGTVTTTREGFFDLFRAMLATRGLVVEAVEAEGLELFRIRSAAN